VGKPNLIASTPHVDKILRAMPCFGKGQSGDQIIFTGAPGIHKKPYRCNNCPTSGKCIKCGKHQTHHQNCQKLITNNECYGEWYGFLNPLWKHNNSTIKYRPQKLCDTWGIKWRDEMDQLKLEWYMDHHRDFQCTTKTLLVNLTSASANRSLGKDVIKRLSKDWDVREFDFEEDIRTNLFLIDQAEHIVTVDTSTVWLAKYLGHKNIHVITPGKLNRHLELGCKQLISDQSTRYCEIDIDLIMKRLNMVL